MWPIIHRPTFETALRGSSPIYRRPPLMLALALAACGARVLPHASSAYRAQASYEWAESARRELLARAEDDLESAQAFTILLDVYSPAGVPGLCYALVKRAATAAEQLRALIAVTSPRTVTEWLFRELVTRLRIFLVSYDLAVSVQTGKPTFGCYFHNHALALPCSEAYFDDPDPVRAFSALQVRWAASPTHSVPVVHLGEPTIESIVKAFQDFAAVPFGGGGSVLALFLMSNFSRHILMTTVRSDPGPSGILRKQAVAMLSVLGESTLKVLPRKVADALAAGDPGPILANWEEFFPQQAIAHTAVQMLLAQDSYSIDRLLVGGFRSAARMRCLTFCGVVRGLVRADRAFRWSHFMLAPPAFKVGVELVAAVVAERGEQIGETPEQRAAREQRACEYEAGVQTVGSCLDALARKYGMEIRRFADLFHEHAEGYGVRIERRVAAPLDAVDPPFREVENAEGWAPFFWDRLFRDGLESVLLGGIPKDLWGNAVSPKAQAGSLVGSPTPSVGSLLNGDSRSL
ncbi:hypothetical protein DFJ74DRAFT_650504 [Hyaloraphidium curvatum]|nr:hypothetical protein DFJ74DRAFT_650504 [Hyaloraphidium curvatum]